MAERLSVSSVFSRLEGGSDDFSEGQSSVFEGQEVFSYLPETALSAYIKKTTLIPLMKKMVKKTHFRLSR